MIPYGRQNINQGDIDAVVAVLQSDFLTQGPQIPQFEAKIAAHTRAQHAIAVNSATSGLHLALSALEVGPGDQVWTTPNSFVASANCALYCGADVDFVDIDRATLNMCPEALAEKLKVASASGQLPKVIIPVHMCGQSPDMAEISALCRAHGIRVIEDASHAIGARYIDQPVGSCQFSDITVFSFHPVKIITTAEGGVVTTNDDVLAAKISRRRSHGITREPADMVNESHGPWYYEQIDLGWNYRMTEIQAALGSSQMARLTAFIDRRRTIAEDYDQDLARIKVRKPGRMAEALSSWHLYVIQLDDQTAQAHRAIFEGLRGAGIGVNLHYIPIYLQPYYQRMGFASGHCPVAEDVYKRSISLPLFPDLSRQDQQYISAALADQIKTYTS